MSLECGMENEFEFCTLHSQLRTWNRSLRSVLRRRLLVFSEALICLSYSGNGLPSRSSESKGWSSRQVTLLLLPVIDRRLCF